MCIDTGNTIFFHLGKGLIPPVLSFFSAGYCAFCIHQVEWIEKGGQSMKQVKADLKRKNIDKSFQKLGLQFEELFPDRLSAKIDKNYEQHQWVVRDIPRFNTVINAVPPDEKLHELPWEEWYIFEGSVHHHVLYTKEPAQYDEIFDAPIHDDIHPPRTLGKKWYVIDDKNMSPVLLR